MSESVVMHPAVPAEEGSTHGGFAEIARQINARHPERNLPISRQLVSRWYACRVPKRGNTGNGFPERRPVVVDGKTVLLFDIEEVLQWHAWWMRKRQAENAPFDPTLGTIPLFEVDQRGHPRDAEYAGHRGHPEVRESYRSSVLDL